MSTSAARNPVLPAHSLDTLCRRLPPFPPLANQLMDLFASEDACLHTAERLIRSDAVFSGELLRLANSAEFSARESFEDITPAVLFLGFERVRNVIRRVTYARLIKDQLQHPFSAEIHRANLATAFVCERLFKAFGDASSFEGFCPYSLGLYLKIGATALLRGYPRDYPRLLCSNFASESDVLAKEAERFGYHHITVSEFLVAQWGFPESFRALVAAHAAPLSTEPVLDPTAVAALAWRLAGSLGFSFLKGLAFTSYQQLAAHFPPDPRIPLPVDAAAWKAAITGHLESLKATG